MLGNFAVLTQRGPFSRKLLTYDLASVPGDPLPGTWFLVPFLHDVAPALFISPVSDNDLSRECDTVTFPVLGVCKAPGIYPEFGSTILSVQKALECQFMGWDDALAVVRFLQDSQAHARKQAKLTTSDQGSFLQNLQMMAARDPAFSAKTAAIRQLFMEQHGPTPAELPEALWKLGTSVRRSLYERGIVVDGNIAGFQQPQRLPGTLPPAASDIVIGSFQERADSLRRSISATLQGGRSVALIVSSETLNDLYATLLNTWQLPVTCWPASGKKRRREERTATIWLSTRQFSSALLPEIGYIVLDMGIPGEWPFFWQRFSLRSLLAAVHDIAHSRNIRVTTGMSALTLSALDACQSSLASIHISETPASMSDGPSFYLRTPAQKTQQGKPQGPYGIILPPVLQQLRKTYDQGNNSLLLLNIRGFATMIECPECGYTATCPTCGATLTLNADHTELFCKQCGHSEKAPDVCPNCHGTQLRSRGYGIDRLARELRRTFPESSIKVLVPGEEVNDHTILPALYLGTYADVQRFPSLRPALTVFPDISIGLQHPVFDNVEQLVAIIHGTITEARGAPVIVQLDRRTLGLQSSLKKGAAAQFLRTEEEQRKELMMPPFSRQFDIHLPWKSSLPDSDKLILELREDLSNAGIAVQGLHADILAARPHAHMLSIEFRADSSQLSLEHRVAEVLNHRKLFQNAGIRVY